MREGVPCAGGSDAPVEDCSPLQGIHDAMRRLPHILKTKIPKEKDKNIRVGAGDEDRSVFLPQERLSFAEALWLYTGGAAYACFGEERLGRIEPGCAADFVVLDRDVTVGEGERLLEAQVEEVWVAGRRRWCRREDAGEGDGDGGSGAGGPKRLDGPYIPGKNGRHGALLPGKRWGVSCCGR